MIWTNLTTFQNNGALSSLTFGCRQANFNKTVKLMRASTEHTRGAGGFYTDTIRDVR